MPSWLQRKQTSTSLSQAYSTRDKPHTAKQSRAKVMAITNEQVASLFEQRFRAQQNNAPHCCAGLGARGAASSEYFAPSEPMVSEHNRAANSSAKRDRVIWRSYFERQRASERPIRAPPRRQAGVQAANSSVPPSSSGQFRALQRTPWCGISPVRVLQ